MCWRKMPRVRELKPFNIAIYGKAKKGLPLD